MGGGGGDSRYLSRFKLTCSSRQSRTKKKIDCSVWRQPHVPVGPRSSQGGWNCHKTITELFLFEWEKLAAMKLVTHTPQQIPSTVQN